MTVFDFAVIAVIGLSALLALARGLVREVLALVTWVAALLVSLAYAGSLAQALGGLHLSAVAAQILAFVVLFVAVLIVGGFVAMLLARAIAAVGLSWIDRLLGAAFGFARGLALVLLGILVAGVTNLPQREWWQRAVLAGPLVAAALEFRDWLPPGWSERLDFSADGRGSEGSGTRV